MSKMFYKQLANDLCCLKSHTAYHYFLQPIFHCALEKAQPGSIQNIHIPLLLPSSCQST